MMNDRLEKVKNEDWIRKPVLDLAHNQDYGEHMDEEVINLCNAINSLPGLHTFESCCGHGKHELRIWFRVDGRLDPELQGLFFFAKCSDRRYWKYGHKWNTELEVGDRVSVDGVLPTRYLLSSGDAIGEEAYKQAEDLIDNMRYFLNHLNLFEGYNLDISKFDTKPME